MPLLVKVTLHPCSADALNEFLLPRFQGKFLKLVDISIRNLAEQNHWEKHFLLENGAPSSQQCFAKLN